MKMEKELIARLVDFMHYLTEENIRPRHYHAGTVVDNFLKSTNCLEAKPKALHSMKEDEKVCEHAWMYYKYHKTCAICGKDEAYLQT